KSQERLGAPAFGLVWQFSFELREGSQRCHALPLKLAHLTGLDVRNQGRVIILPAALLAELPVRTVLAMRNMIRIGLGSWDRCYSGLQPPTHEPEIGRKVGGPIVLLP